MYRYELHCHTAKTSACSRLSAGEMVSLYLANGYDGIFVTDHFLNGNTTVDKSLPYREAVERFTEGYREVKEVAGDRLDVFFGFEYSYKGTDILTYGWDEEILASYPEILEMSMREYCEFCAAHGALAVQAHPFRVAPYIDHIRLFSGIEGVEVMNAGRDKRTNDLAAYYADAYGKIRTGGSDLHSPGQAVLSGMAFEERLHSPADMIRLLREGKGEILRIDNRYRA